MVCNAVAAVLLCYHTLWEDVNTGVLFCNWVSGAGFCLFNCRLDEATGHIDYDALEKSAQLFRPRLIIAGASAYSRNIDYKRMRAIAGKMPGHQTRCYQRMVLLEA